MTTTTSILLSIGVFSLGSGKERTTEAGEYKEDHHQPDDTSLNTCRW